MKKNTKNMVGEQDFSLQRRDFLKGIAATLSLAALPRLSFAAPFTAALPIIPELAPVSSDATTDYFEMHQVESVAQMLPGLNTRLWTYNGISPGPTIRVQRGRVAKVRQHNGLPEPVVTHLHGGHIEAASDGHAIDYIQPNTFKDYTYANSQRAAMLWYHDHTMDVTAPHVYKGLAGVYIIDDPAEDALNLPSGDQEVVLVIQDRTFNVDGSLAYSGDIRGELGDTIIVNGKAQPYFQVSKRKYRFRILNGSNARNYRLALSDGNPLTLIGSDGGLLEAPLLLSDVFMAPAYRTDIVIDFSNYNVGDSVILNNTLGSGTTAEVMRFDITATATDTSVVPSTLSTISPISTAGAVNRTFTFQRIRGGSFTIDRQVYDPYRIDASPRLGDTEIWTLTNEMRGMDHPVHIHDVMWQVLEINGSAPSPTNFPELMGWKDTFNLPGGATAKVIGTFTDYKGVYMMHCHVLEHEDHAMMMNFEVV